jgi:hypothetical protein
MRKGNYGALLLLLSLTGNLLAACDSGSPTPTPVTTPPTATTASRSGAGTTPGGNPGAAATAPALSSGPTATAGGTRAGGSGPGGQATAEWTILMYEDADDEVLEEDMLTDLNEAELIGSTPQVNIIAQVDRLKGTKAGWGNWDSTKRFYVKKGNDFATLESQELADLGETNMADAQTLIDFLAWGITTYPARKYAVILSDHGSGWPGCCGDHGTLGKDKSEQGLALAKGFGPNNLWLMEIDNALSTVRQQTNLDKFEFVGFDECLMSQLEVYNALAPHARYAVASEETEPALGWAYAGFLEQLVAQPTMNGSALATAIVDNYIDKDVKVVAGAAPPSVGDDATLTALDLAALPALNMALDALVRPLAASPPKSVAEARAYTQSYKSVFGEDMPSPYIDLGHFAHLLQKNNPNADVKTAAAALLTAYDKAVIKEKHGKGRPGSSGIAIYFPVQQLYSAADNLGYRTVARRFAAEHLWDDFLASYYTGAALPSSPPPTIPANVMPPAPPTLAAGPPPPTPESAPGPGKGVVQIDPITLSAELASPSKPVNIKTKVVGEDLSYLYFFVGHIEPESELLLVDRLEYVPAPRAETVEGVTYPVWEDGTVAIDFDWQPDVYLISDGKTTVRATFDPEEYGDAPIYRAEGIYTFADGSAPRYANLYFQNGELIDVLVHTGEDDDGALWEVTPEKGDQVALIEKGFNLKEGQEEEAVARPSGTLTVGDQPWTIQQTDAPSGSYVVGFMAEDLQGELSEAYASVFVENEKASAVPGFVPYTNPDLGVALLHPEKWEAKAGDNAVQFSPNAETAALVIHLDSHEAKDAAEADQQAIDGLVQAFAGGEKVQNLEVVSPLQDVTFGGYDGKMVEIRFQDGDTHYQATVIATTPTAGSTYALGLIATEAAYQAALPDFETMVVHFDVLEARP